MNRFLQPGLPLLFMALALLSALNSGAAAGKIDPMSTLSQTSDGSNIQIGERLGELDDIGNEDSKTLTEKCLKVFGHEDFCHCIAGRVVSGTTFENYVKFVLTSKAQLLYSKSSPTRRRAIDAAAAARSTCGKFAFLKSRKAKPH